MRSVILLAIAAATLAESTGMSAEPALAKHKLPLAVGVYVDESVPCKDAAQSHIAAYMGGDMRPQHTTNHLQVRQTGQVGIDIPSQAKLQ